ncbi:MAG: DUF1579 family protein [Planctomycetes bacterium]|nr:DUF1579 family protein [Planctomycetota bacterium]MBI3833008.1 DUF1579 family protein [Planctomycetota bacterium]
MRNALRVLLLTSITLSLSNVVFAQEKKDQPAAKKPDAPKDSAKPADHPVGDHPAAAKPGADHPSAGKPSADHPGAGKPGEMSPEMKAHMEVMMPGPEHQKLAKYAGSWTFKSTMTRAGAPPEETDGAADLDMAFEGRFLHEHNKGTMMGMPFEGGKLVGFNRGSKKYEAVWAYTMGTGILTMNGASDDGGKTIKFSAAFDNEVGAHETFNVTYTFTDDDHFTVKMDGGKMPDGSAAPTLDVKYSRKK